MNHTFSLKILLLFDLFVNIFNYLLNLNWAIINLWDRSCKLFLESSWFNLLLDFWFQRICSEWFHQSNRFMQFFDKLLSFLFNILHNLHDLFFSVILLKLLYFNLSIGFRLFLGFIYVGNWLWLACLIDVDWRNMTNVLNLILIDLNLLCFLDSLMLKITLNLNRLFKILNLQWLYIFHPFLLWILNSEDDWFCRRRMKRRLK